MFILVVMLTLLVSDMSCQSEYEFYDDYQYNEEPGLYYQGGNARRLPPRKSFRKPVKVPQEDSDDDDDDALFKDLLDPTLTVDDATKRLPDPSLFDPVVRPRNQAVCPNPSKGKCFRCLADCNNLKRSTLAPNKMSQYYYLRVCSMGCKGEL